MCGVRAHVFTKHVRCGYVCRWVSCWHATPVDYVFHAHTCACYYVSFFRCHMLCAFSPIPVNDLRRLVIPNSLSRAWKLGRAVWQSKRSKSPLVDAILSSEEGRLLCQGKVRECALKLKLEKMSSFANLNRFCTPCA